MNILLHSRERDIIKKLLSFTTGSTVYRYNNVIFLIYISRMLRKQNIEFQFSEFLFVYCHISLENGWKHYLLTIDF